MQRGMARVTEREGREGTKKKHFFLEERENLEVNRTMLL